ncbi:hypothetical protein [Tautonia rosea]|uniref:hypothetical protein n=1 Tax=Tautonia rosea TaxID=2728037 RepID=UPI0014732C9E|nr:hypothetical protein [Tautonia rosea]
MSALKTRLAWMTGFALCGALLVTGCDAGPGDDPAMTPVEPAAPAMPGDDMGGMDRSGLMRGMPGDAVATPGGESTAPADEPVPADEPTTIEPPADEPAPIETEPADPGLEEPNS